MSTPDRAPLTRLLKELLSQETDRPVEVAAAPLDIDGKLPPSYIVIEPTIGGGLYGPPLCNPNADANFPYIIKSCGLTGDSADILADKVREVILGVDEFGRFTFSMSYPLHKVNQRGPVGPASRLDREGSIFCVSDMYVISVTTST